MYRNIPVGILRCFNVEFATLNICYCSFLTLIETYKIFYLTSIRPTPERNLGLIEEGVSLEELPGDVELILNLRSAQIVMDFVQEVVSSESGASAVDDRVDNVLRGGQVCTPVKFEHVADLRMMFNVNNFSQM